MANIKINLIGVREIASYAQSAKKELLSTRIAICGTAKYIDPQIKQRKNLDSRLNEMTCRLDMLQKKINDISSVVSNGANSYLEVENRAIQRFKELAETRKP